MKMSMMMFMLLPIQPTPTIIKAKAVTTPTMRRTSIIQQVASPALEHYEPVTYRRHHNRNNKNNQHYYTGYTTLF
ncbi:hypothetical protein DOY81_003458 [Sarcophaga bullata]|nr:hypothetical protein DOY81_003458 [Sarcophaga bullata]